MLGTETEYSKEDTGPEIELETPVVGGVKPEVAKLNAGLLVIEGDGKIVGVVISKVGETVPTAEPEVGIRLVEGAAVVLLTDGPGDDG